MQRKLKCIFYKVDVRELNDSVKLRWFENFVPMMTRVSLNYLNSNVNIICNSNHYYYASVGSCNQMHSRGNLLDSLGVCRVCTYTQLTNKKNIVDPWLSHLDEHHLCRCYCNKNHSIILLYYEFNKEAMKICRFFHIF